eukprot:jgi/Psemu1/288513/fgenesh1_pg.266_\
MTNLAHGAICCAAALMAVSLPLLAPVVRAASDGVASGMLGDNGVLYIEGGNPSGWNRDAWYVQVDGVMGGKSSGDMNFLLLDDVIGGDRQVDNGNENGNESESESESENETSYPRLPLEALKFTGDIDLDGGGFSSRLRRGGRDTSGRCPRSIVVVVVPDRVYRTPPAIRGPNEFYDFSSALAVPLSSAANTWTSVYLPMETFDRGTRFGFLCNDNNSDNCRFDPSQINDLSVYVLFQEGAFEVTIASIQAVPEPRSFSPPPITINGFETAERERVVDLLQATVASGGGLYDKSYTELCVAMYWSVLNSLLVSVSSSSSPGFALRDPIRAVICAGLEAAETDLFSSSSTSTSTNRKREAAWTLRYTIDAVVDDLLGQARGGGGGDLGNEWLPSQTEAELMEVTCVARTSPAPGIRYDPTNTYEVDEEWDDLNDLSGDGSNRTAVMFDDDSLFVGDPVSSKIAEMDSDSERSASGVRSLRWSVLVWALLLGIPAVR